jgi:arylsulfatase A-like enzyme
MKIKKKTVIWPCSRYVFNRRMGLITKKNILIFFFIIATKIIAAQEKPNIILLLTDDLGFGDPGCYGNIKIKTPHFDAVAAQGIRLTDAHTPGGVCQPSRYGILTGRYYWRSKQAMKALDKRKLMGFFPAMIEKERTTLPELLKQAGYKTAMIGKWHLGLGWHTKTRDAIDTKGINIDYIRPFANGPVDHGFDYFYGIAGSAGMPPYCYLENNKPVTIPTLLRTKKEVPVMAEEGMTAADWRDDLIGTTITEKAVAYIKKQTNQQAFFLYIPISAPHTPHTPAPAFIGKSGIGLRADMMLEADWTVEQISKAIEEAALINNTIFIITSDNGAVTSGVPGWATDPAKYAVEDDGTKPNGYLRGQKGDIWEGGHRVPFIARWPGVIEPNTVSEQLFCLSDLYASIAALLNIAIPKNNAEDSYNMLTLFTGEKSETLRNSIIHHGYDKDMYSIRVDSFKLIAGQGSGGFMGPYLPAFDKTQPPMQLYNIVLDPLEQTNLYYIYPEKVKQLKMELNRFRKQGYSIKR